MIDFSFLITIIIIITKNLLFTVNCVYIFNMIVLLVVSTFMEGNKICLYEKLASRIRYFLKCLTFTEKTNFADLF